MMSEALQHVCSTLHDHVYVSDPKHIRNPTDEDQKHTTKILYDGYLEFNFRWTTMEKSRDVSSNNLNMNDTNPTLFGKKYVLPSSFCSIE